MIRTRSPCQVSTLDVVDSFMWLNRVTLLWSIATLYTNTVHIHRKLYKCTQLQYYVKERVGWGGGEKMGLKRERERERDLCMCIRR